MLIMKLSKHKHKFIRRALTIVVCSGCLQHTLCPLLSLAPPVSFVCPSPGGDLPVLAMALWHCFHLLVGLGFKQVFFHLLNSMAMLGAAGWLSHSWPKAALLYARKTNAISSSSCVSSTTNCILITGVEAASALLSPEQGHLH